MLPIPGRAELRRRLPRLFTGVVAFGVGLALMVEADLGLAPWGVFHQGISERTGVPIGTVGIFVGLLVLLLWIPLGERFGLGTVLNVVVVGVVVDVTMLLYPTVTHLGSRWVMMSAGLLAIAVGTGLYIGAGLGPGPRDGLMTGLARRGPSIAVVRTGIEVTVLAAGWLLGGTVGPGTLLFSFGIGPLVGYFLPRLTVSPVPAPA